VRLSGRRAVAAALRAEGVQLVFGNPGTSEIPLLTALVEPPEIRYVMTTQEGVAVGMADGYARASRRPAFVCLHHDTGLANGISLLINAAAGGTPLVLCSVNSDVRKAVVGRTNLVAMVEQFTKWSVEITRAEAIAGGLRRAFLEARRPPSGPVYVAFSFDVLAEEAEVAIAPPPRLYPAVRPDPAAVEAAVRVLSGAARPPLMLVGDRVAQGEAVGEAVRLAEALGAEVYAAHFSEVNFPTGHPQFRGQLAMPLPWKCGDGPAPEVILAVGTSVFGGFFYLPGQLGTAGPRLIHVDCAAAEIGRCEATEVGIVADIATALAALTDALPPRRSGGSMERRRARPAANTPLPAPAPEPPLAAAAAERRMPAACLMAVLARELPREVVVVEDAGTSRRALHAALRFDRPGSLFGMRGSAIGWGMGGALGVKLALAERPVVCVVGDGSAMMTVQALWTAASEGIAVVYVICNNASYRVLKTNMDVYRSLSLGNAEIAAWPGTDFAAPIDFAGLARAMGVRGWRVEDPAALAPAIAAALAAGGPAVVDVLIDGAG
jgi:benzoylformate decarboxylase